MKKKLKIRISKDGMQVEIEALGFKGPVCQKVIEQFTAIYGGKEIDSRHKQEWFDDPEVEHQQFAQTKL